MDVTSQGRPAFIIINRNAVENVDLQEALQSRLSCVVLSAVSFAALREAGLPENPVRAVFLSAADEHDHPWLSRLLGAGTSLVLIDGDADTCHGPGCHVLDRPFTARSLDRLISTLMAGQMPG